MSPEIEFRAVISKGGLTPPDEIIADGKIHRFASNGKRSDDSGWYVVFFDGIPAGAYGCWRTDSKGSWRANIGRPLTPVEEKAYQAKIDAARREREREEARRHAEAREEAAAIWKASQPATDDHPYLIRKRVKAHGLRVHGDALVIPMRHGAELNTLQFIGPEGLKRFLTGGRVAGCYFSISSPKGAEGLCICEGFATGASIHEATSYPVAVAFNAGNLLPVAKAVRERFPELRLIVCGDDDARTPGNPGRTKGTEAAQAVGGVLVVPDFGPDRPDWASDFNDLHRHAGLEAVARCIAAAAPAQRPAGNGKDKGSATGVGGRAPPEFITAPHLWRMRHEPTRWAVRQILPEGVTILGGKPKTGKSWLALDVALAVGTGGCALGVIKVEAGPVLYLALEDTKRRLTKRLRILCGNTTPPAEQIEFLTDCLRLGSGGEEALHTWLRNHPTARLVVIDTLPRFRPHANAKETPTRMITWSANISADYASSSKCRSCYSAT